MKTRFPIPLGPACLVALASVLAGRCELAAADSGAEDGRSWTAPSKTVESLQAREAKKDRPINYREENVPKYSLPDPLTCLDGTPVRDAQTWWSKRRPEILEPFRTCVYGRAPIERPENMTFHPFDLDRNAMDGAATRKQVRIRFTGKDDGPGMTLVIFVPNRVPKPVPAFLLICNRDPENFDPTRKVKMPFWPAEEVVARGYGIAAFYVGDIDPDRYDEFKDGVHGLFDKPGARPDDAWGTLAAWAWGASRAMDYFETDGDIDRERVAVIGHSRGGKTSLWAGAQDTRFALVISNDSGCGGAALSRRCYGETVAQINHSFPHWFCANFKKFNGKENELPVDQHMLMALIAPRLLCVASADEDLWADPRGEFLSALNASGVYRLLGVQGLEAEEMPPLDRPLQEGRIGYHIRTGGHGLTEPDWKYYMDFADKHLRGSTTN